MEDLECIVGALKTSVDGIMAQTVPAVVKIAVAEVDDVLELVNDVEVIVIQILQVLARLV